MNIDNILITLLEIISIIGAIIIVAGIVITIKEMSSIVSLFECLK